MLDRPLPHFYDDERLILSQPLLSPETLPRVVGLFRAGDFYLTFHSRVFRAYEVIEEEDKTPDPMTVHAVLRRLELDTPSTGSELSEMMYGIPTISFDNASMRQSVERVHRASDERMAIKLLNRATRNILEGEELAAEIGFLEEAFDALRTTRRRKETGFVPMSEIADEMLGLYEMYFRNETTAIPTGIPELDDRLSERGFSTDDLIIIAGRTAFGKTSLALNIAGNMARAGHVVAYVSREMTRFRLFKRLHAMEVQLNANSIRPMMSDRQLQVLKQTLDIMRRLPILIDDRTSNVFTLRRNVRDISRSDKLYCPVCKKRLCALFCDYLQLMSATDKRRDFSNRVAEVSTISTGLKEIAYDLKMPVVALSQFSRALIGSDGKGRKPVLSDLRESGQIEQDAGVVLFLHGQNPEDEQTVRNLELIIAKQRDGFVTSFPAEFDTQYLTFTTEMVKTLIERRVDDYAQEVGLEQHSDDYDTGGVDFRRD